MSDDSGKMSGKYEFRDVKKEDAIKRLAKRKPTSPLPPSIIAEEPDSGKTSNQPAETGFESEKPYVILAMMKLSEQVESLSNLITTIAQRLEKLETLKDYTSEDSKEMKNMLQETRQNTESLVESSRLLQQEARFDRRENIIKEECRKVIAANIIVWKEKMNERKISFWHYLQNAAKAELYEMWLLDSPDYLPLKYRPKINEKDSDMLLQMKSEEAQQKYTDDIDLMCEYSQQHEERVQKIDSEIKNLINEWTFSEEENSGILEIWAAEVKNNEQISYQLWNKRSNFLLKKKREEEENDSTRFIDDKKETEMKRMSYLKKNRFKMRKKHANPFPEKAHLYHEEIEWTRLTAAYRDNSTGYHDNWRQDCTE
ncbi:MAG: hypothetical protein GY816_09465 [Cytophagales bacterium]|nr:hypothetical protein [Cytophagales bacterium]